MSRRSIISSSLLHLSVILMMVFGLPSLSDKTLDDSHVVMVELLPLSEMTNVKPMAKTKQTEQEPKVKPKPAEKSKIVPKLVSKPKPVVKKAKIEPLPKEKIVEPQPLKEEVKEKEPKEELKDNKPETKDEEPEEDFDSIREALRLDKTETQDASEAKEEDFDSIKDMFNQQDEPVADSNDYKPGLELSISQKDLIKGQIAKHWNVTMLSGAKDLDKMIVTLRIRLQPDGQVIDVKNTKGAQYISNPYYKAAVDSAIRAVHAASPLKHLPADNYNGWKEIELNFDPRDMM